MTNLDTRLQNSDYQNWIKSALCLSLLKKGLEEFADIKSLEFHQKVLQNLANAKIPVTGKTVCDTETISFTKKGSRVSGKITCGHPFCQGFLNAIIQEGIDPNESFTMNKKNLGNTNVSVWHSKHWEVSKLFMNPGQKKDPEQTEPSDTDLSGLINFVAHCRVPRESISNTKLITKVRDARNDIMHSASMMISAADLQSYTDSMIELLEDSSSINTLKGAQNAVEDIKEVLSASICVTMEKENSVFEGFESEIQCRLDQLSINFKEMGPSEKMTQMKQLQEELKNVSSSYDALRMRKETEADLHNKLSSQIENLKQLMMDGIANLTQNISLLQKDVKELKLKDEQPNRIPSEEDEVGLQKYLKKLYKESQLDVPVLPGCYTAQVLDIFSQVKISKKTETTATTSEDQIQGQQGSKSQSDREGEIKSYKNIFHFNKGELKKRVFLLGKAGSGKSTFCRYLVAAWCGGDSQGSAQYPDIDIIKQFKYLFYIQSRFADKSESLLKMICTQLIETNSLKEVVKHVLNTKPDQCLVINDGLDEWKGGPSQRTKLITDTPGLPSFKGLHKCIVLTTSRPWRINALPQPLCPTSRLLEFKGIKKEEDLVKKILILLKEPEPVKACQKFSKAVEASHMSELTQTPLLLTQVLTTWQRNNSLSSSVTVNYCHILDIYIEQSKIETGREGETYEQTEDLCKLKTEWKKYGYILPYCFLKTNYCEQYDGLLIRLGQFAFHLLFCEKNEKSLVFSDQQFQKWMDKKSLDICLKLGLLSQTRAPSCGIMKISNFSFSHKTFQEFMAALWLSINYSEKCQKFQECCKTLNDVFDYSVIIKFICGLAPKDGAKLVRYIDTETDEEMNKYRLKFEQPVDKLRKLIIRCMEEARCCAEESGQQQHLSEGSIENSTEGILQRFICCLSASRSRNRESGQQLYSRESGQQLYSRDSVQQQQAYYLKDVWINIHSTEQERTLAGNQLRQEVFGIKSVCVRRNDELSQQVIKCLKTMTSVIGICLWSEKNKPAFSELELPQQLQSLELEGWDIKDTGVRFPSHLKLLYLTRITFTHEVMKQLPTSLRKCPNLQWLRLVSLTCSDHDGTCHLPGMVLKSLHRLEKLKLKGLSVETVLFPGQQASCLRALKLVSPTLPHHGWEQLWRSLASCSHLQELELKALSCNDHGDSCYLPGLDLQALHRLKTLRLRDLSIESLLLPGQREIQQGPGTNTSSGLCIDLRSLNMSPQGWSSWINRLVHLPYHLSVRMSRCNIEKETRSYISSCPHFTVTEDGIDKLGSPFEFRINLKEPNTSP